MSISGSSNTSSRRSTSDERSLPRTSWSSVQDNRRFSFVMNARRNTFRLSRSSWESSRSTSSVFSNEIAMLILDYFAITSDGSADTRPCDRKTLATCSRVSRAWNVFANKHLYQWVELTSFTQCARFRRTCTQAPHLGKMVRVISLPDTWTNCIFATGSRQQKMAFANIELAAELLHSLPNLEILKLPTTQRVPFNLYASYFDNDSSITTAPFRSLKNLCLNHVSSYDFAVRSPLPWHMDFSSLETLSLSRFVIWHDDVWPMTWPHLPSLRHLVLEECFLDGEELAHLLTQVSDSLRTVHLLRSLFSISIMSDGLGVVADTLEELSVSQQYGFEDTGASFAHFTALKTLRLESHRCSAIYSRLPPNIEKLCISASGDGFTSSKVLDELLALLQTDIKSYLPKLRTLVLEADLNHFGAWADHVQQLCATHSIILQLELTDHQPLAHAAPRTRNRPLLDSFSWTWKGFKAVKRFILPANVI